MDGQLESGPPKAPATNFRDLVLRNAFGNLGLNLEALLAISPDLAPGRLDPISNADQVGQ